MSRRIRSFAIYSEYLSFSVSQIRCVDLKFGDGCSDGRDGVERTIFRSRQRIASNTVPVSRDLGFEESFDNWMSTIQWFDPQSTNWVSNSASCLLMYKTNVAAVIGLLGGYPRSSK